MNFHSKKDPMSMPITTRTELQPLEDALHTARSLDAVTVTVATLFALVARLNCRLRDVGLDAGVTIGDAILLVDETPCSLDAVMVCSSAEIVRVGLELELDSSAAPVELSVSYTVLVELTVLVEAQVGASVSSVQVARRIAVLVPSVTELQPQ